VSSPLIDIPAAVVTALNGYAFSQDFEAVRAYLPKWDIKDDLGTLRVTVVLPSSERNQFTRASVEKLFPVNIAIQQRPAKVTPALIDPMVTLADEIADFWKPGPLGSTGAVWLQTEHTAIYLPEHLEQHNLFTSLVTVHFRL